MRPMINSEKHIVQLNRATTTGPAGFQNLNLVTVLEQGVAAALPQDVVVGTNVKAVWLEWWCSGSNNDQSAVTAILYKTVGGEGPIDTADMSLLHNYNNKKNILATFQGILGDSGSANPVPIFRGWYKIPKGKSRFGLGDKLRIGLQAKDTDVESCGLAIYKAYT